MVVLPRYLIVGCVILSTCLGYQEEQLKKEIRNGVFTFLYDVENGLEMENTLDYFPVEIEELIPQIRKYFMGKQKGYSTTQVLILIQSFDKSIGLGFMFS